MKFYPSPNNFTQTCLWRLWQIRGLSKTFLCCIQMHNPAVVCTCKSSIKYSLVQRNKPQTRAVIKKLVLLCHLQGKSEDRTTASSARCLLFLCTLFSQQCTKYKVESKHSSEKCTLEGENCKKFCLVKSIQSWMSKRQDILEVNIALANHTLLKKIVTKCDPTLNLARCQ